MKRKINKRMKSVLRINPNNLLDVKLYESIADASIDVGCSGSTISRVCQRYPSSITAGGYFWCYKKDYDINWTPTESLTEKIICIETGAIYKNCSETSRLTGFNSGVLYYAIRNHKTVQGYHLVSVSAKNKKLINSYKNFIGVQPLSKRVKCIDTGEEFESLSAASKSTKRNVRYELNHSNSRYIKHKLAQKPRWEYTYDDRQWNKMLSHKNDSGIYGTANIKSIKVEKIIRPVVKQYGRKNKVPVICVETGVEYSCAAEAQKQTGVKQIYMGLYGVRTYVGGFTWRYKYGEIKKEVEGTRSGRKHSEATKKKMSAAAIGNTHARKIVV